jgi:uncharacterized membrane protein YdjX (TVP38/TMEM64 family)
MYTAVQQFIAVLSPAGSAFVPFLVLTVALYLVFGPEYGGKGLRYFKGVQKYKDV